MIIYVVGQGKIYAGNTELASSLNVIESAPLELTISTGSYTSTGDKGKGKPPRTYNLETAAVCSIFNTETDQKYYTAELVASEWAVEILWKSFFPPQLSPPYPVGFEYVATIVFPFIVPPFVQSIADIEICVLQVIPGFPPGTGANDWYGIPIVVKL